MLKKSINFKQCYIVSKNRRYFRQVFGKILSVPQDQKIPEITKNKITKNNKKKHSEAWKAKFLNGKPEKGK